LSYLKKYSSRDLLNGVQVGSGVRVDVGEGGGVWVEVLVGVALLVIVGGAGDGVGLVVIVTVTDGAACRAVAQASRMVVPTIMSRPNQSQLRFSIKFG